MCALGRLRRAAAAVRHNVAEGFGYQLRLSSSFLSYIKAALRDAASKGILAKAVRLQRQDSEIVVVECHWYNVVWWSVVARYWLAMEMHGVVTCAGDVRGLVIDANDQMHGNPQVSRR